MDMKRLRASPIGILRQRLQIVNVETQNTTV